MGPGKIHIIEENKYILGDCLSMRTDLDLHMRLQFNKSDQISNWKLEKGKEKSLQDKISKEKSLMICQLKKKFCIRCNSLEYTTDKTSFSNPTHHHMLELEKWLLILIRVLVKFFMKLHVLRQKPSLIIIQRNIL